MWCLCICVCVRAQPKCERQRGVAVEHFMIAFMHSTLAEHGVIYCGNKRGCKIDRCALDKTQISLFTPGGGKACVLAQTKKKEKTKRINIDSLLKAD